MSQQNTTTYDNLQLLKVHQVAEELQTSHEHVRRMVKSGQLPGIRFSDRGHIRIRRIDLDEFIERGSVTQ